MGTRRLLIGLFALTLLLLLPEAPVAQGSPPSEGPVTVQITLTQTSLKVGDQIGLRLTVTHPSDIHVEFPILYDKLGQLEVLGARQLDSLRNTDGAQVSAMEYTITGFVPGRYQIPPLSVTYVDPQGEQHTITAADELPLEIVSLLAALPDAQLRDIKPPVVIPQAPIAYDRTLALVALCVGSLGLVVLAYRSWPRGLRPALIPAAALAPEMAARQELERIARLDLLARRDYTTYYGLISSCIRRYLDARFDLHALGSTTEELRRTMESLRLDRWQARVIRGLLEECDAAKWARYEPVHARAERALTIAFEIVDLTPSPQDVAPLEGHWAANRS